MLHPTEKSTKVICIMGTTSFSVLVLLWSTGLVLGLLLKKSLLVLFSTMLHQQQVNMSTRPGSCMHFLIIIIVLLLSAISVTRSAPTENENLQDRMALLALRAGFIAGRTPPGEDHALYSWNSSLHLCDWKGITCGKRHRRVTVISLGEQKLNGVLSPSIGNLTFLRELYLGNNSLYGEIPKQIGNLRRLQYLNLRVNSFQGRIPTELSNCSNLTWLSLAYNNLSGNIPFQLGILSKMSTFFVGKNNFVGEMPNFLRNFSSLAQLHLGYNDFHGEIKDSLQGLSKLTLLSLLVNRFSGTIFPLYNLSSLTHLELNRNNFSGTLLQDIDILFPKLRWLSLPYNSFTGTIPSTLSNISGLNIIQLNANKFTGRIPENLGHLKGLRILLLSDNNLGGSDKPDDLRFINSLTNCTELGWLILDSNRFGGRIPNSIGNLSSIVLDMSENYITGSIPEAIGEFSTLTWVDFGGNLLTGIIPDAIGNLANISILSLYGNKLHGEIPYSIGKLTSLYELNLASNLLNGTIPPTLRNCMRMQHIDISSNLFVGNLPDGVFNQFENLDFCNLSHNSFVGGFPLIFGHRTLNTLDASYNNFSGEIPAQLSESLEFLSMARNSLHGNIPASLGSLKGLKWLDLSCNNLSGSVTEELASLTFLQNLNLSFNRLEGEFPLFKNVSGVSVIGNSKLCGGNLELHLLPCFYPNTRKSVSGKIIIAAILSAGAFLSLIVLLFIFLQRRRRHKKDGIDEPNEVYWRITYAELFAATEGFSESKLIGAGSFGDVFAGILDGDESKRVAVKVLKSSNHGAAKSFMAECKVLRSIRHRNLLRIITSCSSLDHQGNDFKALVFDFMSNGNLDSWLHISKQEDAKVPLNLAKRLQIAIDVGCALNYLHNCCEAPIVHCDLKPSNILLDDDMVAHVGDFGLAKLLYEDTKNGVSGVESLSSAIRGTIGYVAPEYGMGASISAQGDMYSYGILLLELITGKSPTDEMFNNEMDIRSFVERALPPVHIKEVVDQLLVDEFHNAMAAQKSPEHYKLQWEMLVATFLEVGISCSVESSKDRMEIQSAIKCLTSIKVKCNIIC